MGRRADALMRYLFAALAALGSFAAQAWGNHALLSYRALEGMPEVRQAGAVTVQPLESFFRDSEPALARLLDDQETWARVNIRAYSPRPDELRFVVQAGWNAAERRAAFLRALRLSPGAGFALFVQPDPRREGVAPQGWLAHEQVSTVPLSKGATQRFLPLQAGQSVAALDVVASASDEPDYGYDIDLFDDNPHAARGYALGKQPFGNPALRISSQAPFHMGFFHQGAVFNTLAPAFARTFTQLRVHQYGSLAQLAFRTGHPYWGWRFTGLMLHYIQDLTQPYHASAAPGERLVAMVWANTLDKLGFQSRKAGMVVLQSNRHFVLERYQTQLVLAAALARTDTPNERALRDTEADTRYPAWHAHYARDVVAAQAYEVGPETDAAIVVGAPARFVTDPNFDFGAQEAALDLDADMRRQLQRQREDFQSAVARLLQHFGSHSRNAIRGVLRGVTDANAS